MTPLILRQLLQLTLILHCSDAKTRERHRATTREKNSSFGNATYYATTTPSPFLINLYEQIKNLDHEQQREILAEGNTVRALHPITVENTHDSRVWVFDTSRLPSAEDIVHVEIRGESESPIIVKLLKYRNKKYYKELRSHLVFRQRDTWNSTDVAKMIRRGRHTNHVITVTIKQSTTSNNESVNPIVVLYANDSSEINARPFDEIVRRKRSLSPAEPESDDMMTDKKVLNRFHDERHSRRVRRCRKQKKHRSKHSRRLLSRPDQDCRGLKKAAKAEKQATMSMAAASSKTSCKRRSMYINFEEIGWKKWIIAPAGFEAYYCGGQCGYDEAQYMRKTNHAMMQSIMNRFTPTIPEPSCVPDKMLSLTILFEDADVGHNVLRVFPDMSVSSCSCR